LHGCRSAQTRMRTAFGGLQVSTTGE
jgi:hypothetical protein